MLVIDLTVIVVFQVNLMSVILEVYAEQKLVVTRFSGEFNVESILSLREQAIKKPDFSADFAAIDDVSEVENISITPEDLMHLSEHSLMNIGVRRGIVVSNEMQYGIASIYQAHCEQSGQKIKIFRDFNEARIWVGHTDQE